jgi:hypothetical protein
MNPPARKADLASSPQRTLSIRIELFGQDIEATGHLDRVHAPSVMFGTTLFFATFLISMVVGECLATLVRSQAIPQLKPPLAIQPKSTARSTRAMGCTD